MKLNSHPMPLCANLSVLMLLLLCNFAHAATTATKQLNATTGTLVSARGSSGYGGLDLSTSKNSLLSADVKYSKTNGIWRIDSITFSVPRYADTSYWVSMSSGGSSNTATGTRGVEIRAGEAKVLRDETYRSTEELKKGPPTVYFEYQFFKPRPGGTVSTPTAPTPAPSPDRPTNQGSGSGSTGGSTATSPVTAQDPTFFEWLYNGQLRTWRRDASVWTERAANGATKTFNTIGTFSMTINGALAWGSIVRNRADSREELFIPQNKFLAAGLWYRYNNSGWRCLASALATKPGLPFRISMDISKGAAAIEFASKAMVLCEEWYPKINELLFGKGAKLPFTEVKIRFESYAGAAEASGNSIRINTDWVLKYPGDTGMVIHELTHVVQSYKNGDRWLAEGIADYIRHRHYEPGVWDRKVNVATAKLNEGYRTTAAFLIWLEGNKNGNVVSLLNKACRAGTYNEYLFKTYCGADVNTLWKQFLAAQSPTPAVVNNASTGWNSSGATQVSSGTQVTTNAQGQSVTTTTTVTTAAGGTPNPVTFATTTQTVVVTPVTSAGVVVYGAPASKSSPTNANTSQAVNANGSDASQVPQDNAPTTQRGSVNPMMTSNDAMNSGLMGYVRYEKGIPTYVELSNTSSFTTMSLTMDYDIGSMIVPDYGLAPGETREIAVPSALAARYKDNGWAEFGFTYRTQAAQNSMAAGNGSGK